MVKVDVLKVFISTAGIFGVGLIWFKFNRKIFKTVRYLAAAPFSEPPWCPSEPDSSSQCDHEEGDLSDDCSVASEGNEVCPPMPEQPPFSIN